MKITYTGLRDDKFNYVIELNGHTFTYFQGIGHCYVQKTSEPKKSPLDFPSSNEQYLASKAFYKPRYLSYNERIYIKFPQESDILECLKLDVECGQMSFYEFCDNFGYDKDSIKDQETHRACMETADKLRGFKFPENLEEVI